MARVAPIFYCLLFFAASPSNVLAAEDCGIPAPRTIPPFEGLIDESKVKQGDASVIENISTKRVALIVSTNAEKQLAWNESISQVPTGHSRRMTELLQAQRDANNPKLIVDRMVSPFVAAAQETKLMSDLAEFRDSGLELAIVLDINFKCSVISRDWWTAAIEYEAEVELAGYPLSPTFVMGPAVYGRSKLRGRYEAGWADVERQVRDGLNLRLAAAKDFQANVARAYPVTKPASRPAGIDTSQARTADQNSVQTRLQAVEDLRKRGLISEAEAEAKRQEILKSL